MKFCIYDKTVMGNCPQQALPGNTVCYYHDKVLAGLIETAEDEVMRDMPTFKER